MTLDSAKFHIPPPTRLTFIGWAVASFVAAYTAPFGTDVHAFEARAVYWSLVIVSSTLFARGFLFLVLWALPGRRGLVVDVAISVLMVLFFSPVPYFAAYVLFGADVAASSGYLMFMQYVAIISVAVCVSRRLIGSWIKHQGWRLNDGDPAEETPPPRLTRRLPDEFEGQILRLTVEDHFVDVVAETGTYRIRLRFADAVDEMDSLPGFCTHRSHWVARDAIAGVRREAGKIWLEITNGDLVPVSRKYRADLENAGML